MANSQKQQQQQQKKKKNQTMAHRKNFRPFGVIDDSKLVTDRITGRAKRLCFCSVQIAGGPPKRLPRLPRRKSRAGWSPASSQPLAQSLELRHPLKEATAAGNLFSAINTAPRWPFTQFLIYSSRPSTFINFIVWILRWRCFKGRAASLETSGLLTLNQGNLGIKITLQTLQMDPEDAFSETSLTEKLTKLNSSQQSIESLSHWCISHREKAKQVVETWQALFNTVPKERRVSFLYLANDILQNSRRKGSEFVSEFWKVLPKVLRGVCDGREENCKKVASRLVDIWTERKVFGSRGEKLKNEFLSKKSSPSRKPSSGKNLSHVNVEKSSNPIKVLKRDANSLRIRLAVGGLPEKILSAFRLVLDETVNEEDALKDCQDAVLYLRDMENEVIASRQGDPVGPDTVSDIQKQETMLRHGIGRLEKIEANRVVLISQLREALQSHESKLQMIRNELLTAHGLIEHAGNMKRRLSENMKESPVEPTNNHLATPGTRSQPVGSLTKPTVSQEESNRAAAAAVAAKLAASTSSAQMLSSVLSSLMAEELMNGSPKRLKLEKPATPIGAEDPKRASPAHFQGVTGLAPPLQSFFPPPPMPPLVPPPGFPAVQLAQPSMVAGLTYGHSGSPFPIPGPQPLPPGSSGGYYGSVGVGFDGEGHQRGALPPPPVNPQ